jgi:tetratricopeptide (TPR) repeat protein
VNEKDFDIVKISDTDRLGVDIIMAAAGTVEAAKKEYYNVSDKALLEGFNKEIRALRLRLQKAQLSQQEYEEKYGALQAQYERQKKELDRLAEKFARVNFDDVSALYREALKLFKKGRIDEAIKKLEMADLLGRTARRLEERKRIEEAEEELARQKAENEKGLKEDIQALQLQAKMYGLKFEISKAEALYDQLLKCDSTRLDILLDCADFYRENHFYQKALGLYPKIIQHPQAEDWQKANACGDSGDVYTAVGRLDEALGAYIQAQNQYARLAGENPSSSFYKNNLAISYSKLGETHTSLGNLDKALGFYEKDLKLTKELYDAYPNNVEFKNGLALSYQWLGITYEIIENKAKAKECYRLSKKLFSELVNDFPRYVEFKKNLDWVENKLRE